MQAKLPGGKIPLKSDWSNMTSHTIRNDNIMYLLLTTREVKAKFFFIVFMDRDEVEIYNIMVKAVY